MELNSYPNVGFWNLFATKLKTPSIFVFVLIIIFSVTTFKHWINWSEYGPFTMDVDQYYSYLVARFIHHDFSFHFQHNYWLIPSPSGLAVPKVTMGIAFMYLPFFVIADNIAYSFDYSGLGYSAPYMWCIHFGSIIYVIIGLWYCRKSLLLLFFNEWIIAAVILLILFGTNLFFYTYKQGEMAHGHLFFLFSVFIFHVLKWRRTQKIKYVYYFSFIAGFVTLIRPTEILILLFPLLIDVSSFKDLKLRITEILNLKWKLIFVVLLFFIPIIPQLIFWKIYTGQFLFFSYGSSEGFFFGDPKIYSVLLGWHKGWLLYTPLMFFVLVGLGMMLFKWKKMGIGITVYFLINLYLISSWWDWGFGGAFGMRAFVQSYAFFVFPLAYLLKFLFELNKKRMLMFAVKGITVALFAFFCFLNVFQTTQFNNNLIHWDGMTKESYSYLFLSKDVDRIYLETLFKTPNYDEMRKGNRNE